MDWGNILRASREVRRGDRQIPARHRSRSVERRPGAQHRHRLHRRFERNAGTPDAGQLLVALGSLADYLAWRSDGGPYNSLLPRVKQLLAGVGHGQAFEECLMTTLTTPPLAEAKVGKWKDAAAFKFCVDGAIDRITKDGIQAADVAKASR